MSDLIAHLRKIGDDLYDEGSPFSEEIISDAICEIERLRQACVGVNVGVKEGDVVGIPELVRTGRWKWSVLGEDGKRFDLVPSEVGVKVEVTEPTTEPTA